MTEPSSSHPDPLADPLAPRRGADDPLVVGRDEFDVGRGDLDESFWGTQSDWTPTADRQPEDAERPGLARWWSSVTAGRSRAGTTPSRQRFHGGAAPTDEPDQPIESSEFAESTEAGTWPDEWTTDDPRRGGVDPLIARLGGLAIVLTIMVPVIIGFTTDGSDDLGTADDLGAAVPSDIVIGSAAADTTQSPTAAAPQSTTAAGSTLDTSAQFDSAPATEPSAASAAAPTAVPTGESEPEPESAPSVAALSAPRCGQDYEIVSGDFWIRLADGAGVDISDLLAVNDATQNTPLYPGRTICLPEGASVPAPPPTPATVAAPSTSSGSSTTNRTPSTTATTPTPAPTTAPPTTAAPPPAPTASAAEVQAIIRAVWPDDLEDRALEIAWRESNYRATAKNYCCYGVFQIYWNVHKGWLVALGITSADQLYDPTLNARAALMLYERAGGWGPWGG